LGERLNLGVGDEGHGAVRIGLDGARSSPFLAEFIDAPAISGKSALDVILAKGKGKILCVRSAVRQHTRGPSRRHACSNCSYLPENKPPTFMSPNVYVFCVEYAT
jgi:hypothetical protein